MILFDFHEWRHQAEHATYIVVSCIQGKVMNSSIFANGNDGLDCAFLTLSRGDELRSFAAAEFSLG
jgi:hypothetical protein